LPDQIVPVTNDPNQTLTVALAVDGASLTLKLGARFSLVTGYWLMNVSDRFNNLLLSNVPLLCGLYPASNLLAPFGALAIGSAYIVNASGSASDSPDETNLGTDFLLVWGDTAA
jgi:hypothetical protein